MQPDNETGSKGEEEKIVDSAIEAASEAAAEPVGSSAGVEPAPSSGKATPNIDAAVKDIIASGKLSPGESKVIQDLLNDHAALKTKIDRLKGLLGRSAKAQREAAVDLKNSQKKLDQALKDVKRLNDKVDRLSSRPTHMDLLNDFETNFDRALLSVGTGQAGGEDTAAPQATTIMDVAASAVDTMLMQELEESRQRLAKLEQLNSSLMRRSHQLETEAKEKKQELSQAMMKLQHMDLELKMSRMEAAQAQRAMEEKAASLEEMQMEIDMVTKASMKANVRAAQGEAVAKSSKTDRQYITQLESQVQALKEWALASAESKRLALERVSILEKKLKMQGAKLERAMSTDDDEEMGKVVYSKHGSLVVGAGDVGHIIVEPDDSVEPGKRLMLRWKFDASPSDQVTDFNVMKGKCTTTKAQSEADYMIKDRSVTGGAAGTLEDAFTQEHACTILWSNKKSWIRPRVIKYAIEIMSFEF